MRTIKEHMDKDICLRCAGEGKIIEIDEIEGIAEKELCCYCDGDGKFHVEQFTCHDCGASKNCEFAYDLYNTSGDCLAEK